MVYNAFILVIWRLRGRFANRGHKIDFKTKNIFWKEICNHHIFTNKMQCRTKQQRHYYNHYTAQLSRAKEWVRCKFVEYNVILLFLQNLQKIAVKYAYPLEPI